MSAKWRDALSSGRYGLRWTRADYRERRRIGRESPAFTEAFHRASFIMGWLRRSEAELLFELAAAVPTGQDIVELGSYLGRSTAFLALGAGAGHMLHSVDPHDHGRLQHGDERLDTSAAFRRNMAQIGVAERVAVHVTVAAKAAQDYSGAPVGLLFVDTSHSEDSVVEDTSAWVPRLAPGAVVVFDDVDQVAVSRGLARLVAAGLVPPLEQRVGKIGVARGAGRPARSG